LIDHFLPASNRFNIPASSSSLVGFTKNCPSLYQICTAPTGQSNGIPAAIIDTEDQIMFGTSISIV